MTEVYFFVYRFLDFEGREPTYGGMQRYTYNLARLLEARGHRAAIVQKSTAGRWEKGWGERSRVVGLPCSPRWWGNLRFNVDAHRFAPPDAPIIYASNELATPIGRMRSVGIQHGVWWDGRYGWVKLRLTERQQFACVRRTGRTICVDTNFINWYRARFSDRADAAKLTYIPNYADAALFGDPPPFTHRDREDLTILFPRRSHVHRGMYLMADATAELLKTHPRLRFRYLVGSGYETDRLASYLRKRGVATDGGAVEIGSLPFDRMGEAYREADITCVPTLWSEGTSLSAIEAMWHGGAVVATNVGGLGNIILDGDNGLLTDVDGAAFTAALRRLVEDHELRRRLGARAHETARRCFSLDLWERRVWDVLAPIVES